MIGTGNSKIYAESERRFAFYTSKALKASFLACSAALSPFVGAAYDLSMGNYTVDSWAFLIKFW